MIKGVHTIADPDDFRCLMLTNYFMLPATKMFFYLKVIIFLILIRVMKLLVGAWGDTEDSMKNALYTFSPISDKFRFFSSMIVKG